MVLIRGKIMNYIVKIATATVFVLAAGQASAATFNFDTDATDFWNANVPGSSSYEGTFDQVYGISTVDGNARATAAGTLGGNTDAGVTVTASATVLQNNQRVPADPFMDSRGPLAGLGVCSSGLITSGGNAGKSQCSSGVGNNTGDDNLLFSELLELAFNGKKVVLDGLQIRDADHNLINGTDNAILINGQSFGTGENGQVVLAGLPASKIFTFTSGSSNEQIYLSVLEVSQVPLPAAGFLLLGALGGLGAMSKRRRA